jgi:pimeloyl-ACP methyl ester carboxylesterase
VTLVERMNRRASIQSIVGYARAILDHDDLAVLPQFKGLPILVVVGDGDPLTPPGHSRRLAEALPGSRLELIAEAGHSPQLEYPGEISQLLLEMIDKVAAEIGDGSLRPEAAPPGADPGRHRRWKPFPRRHGRA